MIIMSRLKRYYHHGNLYFIIAVTHKRQKILVHHKELLWDSLIKFRNEANFIIIAYVILSDHFHIIIEIHELDLSAVMQKIKLSFSKKLRTKVGRMDGIIWQRRFWDHVIRDQKDLNTHFDYIHYNPVKHGLTGNPFEWEHSSIHDFHAEGYYPVDWGVIDKPKMDGDYGE